MNVMEITLRFPFDRETIAFVNHLVQQSNSSSNNQIPEPAAPGVQVASDPASLQAIAREFAYWLDKAEENGSVGQKLAMRYWLLNDGKVGYNDLIAASGAKDRRVWAPIINALIRNMRKVKGPNGGAPGLPSYPATWFGWVKDETANGGWVYIIEPTLLPYFKDAFGVAHA